MEPGRLLEELQNSEEDTVILKKLINFASSRKESLDDEHLKKWHPVLARIIEIFIPSVEVEREKMLLASHAFFALLSMQPSHVFLKDTLNHFFTASSNRLDFSNRQYNVVDPKLFKLICAYGYLQVNRKEIYFNNLYLIMFELIYRNSISYSKHSYFAYKVLDMWLHRSIKTDFWSTCSTMVEQKLEAIIFSNWCNAINEISKQNSTSIFNIYLKIMQERYEGYLEYIFKNCLENISWQNQTKYAILAEICEVWDNIEEMTSREFLLSLCTSLTKYHLRSAGTKVYIAILKKLNEDQWNKAFGCIMQFLFENWDTADNANHNALELLCKHWLEPTFKKYKNVLPHLWELTRDLNGRYVRSFFERMASELYVDLPEGTEVECYINDKNEIVRLNGFRMCCHKVNASFYMKKRDRFFLIREFLWHNANSISVCMRDGIVKYLKIFYVNLLKLLDAEPGLVEDVDYITHWLHEFFLDCFEIGSCYQRKILGLNSYKAMLSFTDGTSFNKCNNMENATCILLWEKYTKISECWKFTDKKSLFALLRLVLDSASDVRQLATRTILDYFDKNLLTHLEHRVLYTVALENCNSSKFYKIESGAALMTILASWLQLNILQNSMPISDTNEAKNLNNHIRYANFLLDEATCQLAQMKEDLLKSIVQNKPFYGVLTALLNVAFRNGPESSLVSLEFVEKILNLLRNAVDFFLSVLSSKSESAEYSSSFAEMGLAIDETIKTSEVDDANYDQLNLTPAHQVLVSCIWISLKISCELAWEIGVLMYSDEVVKSCADIIVTVLLKCRHKGAVESAGTAIGNLTRFLCKEPKYCELPKIYILNILKDDAMNSLNVTRRGAGLSIMFHKIVVSDNRQDRPLLHFAMETLLDLLDDCSEASMKIVESKHDSPWARRLHFLRALVADKEISAQLVSYMERITLTCFRYLESEVWTIRNASLQLFGAVVPRLMGQSYGDAFLDFGAGYNINHFVTHYPILADHVMKQLQYFSSTFMNFSTALYLHSNIVHVLILLSKVSCSSCDLIDYSSQEYTLKAKRLLRPLFNNPVLYVRLLAAKAYSALTAFSSIRSDIETLNQEILSCCNVNSVHGHLLAIKYLKEKYSVEMSNTILRSNDTRCTRERPKQHVELLRYKQILKAWNDISEGKDFNQPSYVLESLFLQLSESSFDESILSTDIFPFDRCIKVLSSQKVQPGFFQFVDVSTKLCTDYINRTNNIGFVNVCKILDSHCIDQTVAFLNYLSPNLPILEIILERLLSNSDSINELLRNTMVNFVLRTLKHASLSNIGELRVEKLMKNLVATEIVDNMLHSNLYRLEAILIVMFSGDQSTLSQILSHIFSMSVHEEEYTRQLAVELMQFSAYRFARLSNENKLTVLHCCLILLKDEIPEIREAIAGSLREHILLRINKKHPFKHEEIIYQELLSEVMLTRSHLVSTSKDKNFDFIKLFTQNIKNLIMDGTIENPFYHDDNPFYREESKFLNLCFYYIQKNNHGEFEEGCSENNIVEFNKTKNSNLLKIQAKYQLQEEARFNCTNLEILLNIKYVNYLSRKLEIVLQDNYNY